MKKLLITALFIACLLLSTSAAYAYTYTLSTILSDALGNVQLDVGVWDPNVGGNPYSGTGFFGYNYTIKNLTYNTYLTDFAIIKPGAVSVVLVSTPANWNYKPYAGSFGWDADGGFELYTGSTQGGFEVKSTSPPFTSPATAWRPGYNPANGITLGPGVPEPTSVMLLGIGLMGLAGKAFRKRFMA